MTRYMKKIFVPILVFIISSSVYSQIFYTVSTLIKIIKSIYIESRVLFKLSIKFPVNYNYQKKLVLICMK